MGHLSQRMHPRIRTPGGRNRMRARLKAGECRLDCRLYRRLVGLSLPTRKGATVIFDLERVSRHAAGLARRASIRNATGEPASVPLCCVRVNKEAHRVVLTTIADGVADVAQGIYDTGASLLGEPTIRLGVTGLARSGKTVFISSLVANLLDRGRMPHLLAASEGRIAAAYLQPQPDDTIPRFDYEAHMAALLGSPPAWPESTRMVSELRVSLRVRPKWASGRIAAPAHSAPRYH